MARRCALLVGLLASAADAIQLRRAEVTSSSLEQEAQQLEQRVDHALAQLHSICPLKAAFLQNGTAAANGTAAVNRTAAAVVNHTAASAAVVNHTNASAVLCQHNRSTALQAEQDSLEALVGHLKLNIKRFNTDETSGKSEGAKMLKQVEARLAADQEKLKNASLSKFQHEMLVNRTRSEENEVHYWKRGRELEHSMFHANLKMTHGLMSRVKTVIEAYKEVLAKGHISAKMAEDIKRVGASVPKAFIEIA
jgi:hypothetical protein